MRRSDAGLWMPGADLQLALQQRDFLHLCVRLLSLLLMLRLLLLCLLVVRLLLLCLLLLRRHLLASVFDEF